MALLLTCGDGEERGEVYGCAADRQQASIVFEVAADMVRMCPALNKRVKILASQKRIVYQSTNSFYQVLSAEAYSKHGFNIHGVVFDELHTQPNRKLFDVMTKGSGDARTQPLYFLITTAGTDTNSIGSMEYHIESTKTNAGTRKLPMTEDVFRMFQAILEDRPTDFPEIMVDGYVGFLFRDKNGMPEVALHWEHRLKNAVNRYNSIFRVQLPKITPHICRHTYCSNQAKAGMNPKTLQYLMGHSDIGVTMNTYTHLGLDDAKNEMIRMEELEQARKEVDKAEDKKPMKQNMFKVV